MASVFKANVPARPLRRVAAKQERKCNIFAQYQLFHQAPGERPAKTRLSKLLSCKAATGGEKRHVGKEKSMVNPKNLENLRNPSKPEHQKT